MNHPLFHSETLNFLVIKKSTGGTNVDFVTISKIIAEEGMRTVT